MKQILISIALLFTTSASYAHPRRQQIDSLLDYYAQTLQFNGVAFVSVKGEILLNKGYGFKDWQAGTPNGANTVFQIGSVTKQFTSEIILMLAKEKKLSLQDKLSKYFPDFPSADSIRIENLLTHTSGIYNYTDDTLWQKHPTKAVTHAQMLSIMKSRPTAFKPGEKFDYSNSNYILLSYIIEQVSKEPYTVVVRERILKPIGMTQSGFDFAGLRSSDKPVGYNCVLIDTFHKDRMVDSTLSYGAGALYCSAGDLYKWHQALHSYRLLDKEWQQKAYTPFKDNYGYGWMIKEVLPGIKVYAHSGGINGFASYFARVEKEDVCIVLLSNIQYGGASEGQMTKSILRCLFDTAFRIPATRRIIQLSDENMKRYEGEYVFAIDSSMRCAVTLDKSRMLFQLTNQPQDRMYPQSENLFFTKTADAQFEFVPDETRGYKLLLHQHGEKFEALRAQVPRR